MSANEEISRRSLPSVDQVLRKLTGADRLLHDLVVNEIREVLAECRGKLDSGRSLPSEPIEQIVEQRLHALLTPSLRPVINATGVILHTNLGRAPLPAFQPISGYSNLEYDLTSGKRGKRDAHTQVLLQKLLGRPGIVVNNNAAAVYLVLNEFAAGGEVIVSRGELIEIGDGFRIPDIMARSGAILREVGTTNRTRLEDYSGAINERTRLILRVHPSNFRMTGFTERPALQELAALAHERAIPLYEDLGSGCVFDVRPYGLDEPAVRDSIVAGVDIVSFSCDKLLGGPQAGIIAGIPDLVQRVRRNPMYRALRVDKLILQSLQTTLLNALAENWECIPALRMIRTTEQELRARAERIAARLEGIPAQIRASHSAIGGGSTPDQQLPTWVIELEGGDAVALEQRLRSASTPVIARIERDRVLLDLRTIRTEDEEALIASVRSAY